jgi:hypothetical protein
LLTLPAGAAVRQPFRIDNQNGIEYFALLHLQQICSKIARLRLRQRSQVTMLGFASYDAEAL